MAEIGVHSEVGKLRRVIVHRPDLSLRRLTPGNHDELLFDDVLWVERAQWEHDQFVARHARARRRGPLRPGAAGRGPGRDARSSQPPDRSGGLRVRGGHRARRRGPSPPGQPGAGCAGPPPDRRPDDRRVGPRSRPAGEHVPDRRGRRRRVHLRPAAPAEFAVHARLVVLDLRRRLGQPDVLAGPPPRGATTWRRSIGATRSSATREFEFWYPPMGDDDRFRIEDFGLASLEGGDVEIHRQRHRADRHLASEPQAG